MLSINHRPTGLAGCEVARQISAGTTTNDFLTPIRWGPSCSARRSTSDRRAFASETVQTWSEGDFVTSAPPSLSSHSLTWTIGRIEGRWHLHRRVHEGTYRATPVRRVNIPKPDGGTRPLGVAALEDKIVQRAMMEVILTPDAGGAAPGLHQDRLGQGSAGAVGDPAPRGQERHHPGGDAGGHAAADPGGRLGHHRELSSTCRGWGG